MRAPRDRPAGAPEAWEQLLATHLDAVYGYILRRVGNRADAEDLTHDVFVRAWRWLDLGRSEGEVGSWLVRAARTVIAEHWRQHRRDRELAVRAREPLHPSHDNPRSRQQVDALLGRLRSRYRTVLELRFLEGLSVGEVAGRMGLSAGNVRILQHRALRAAAELSEGGPTDGRP